MLVLPSSPCNTRFPPPLSLLPKNPHVFVTRILSRSPTEQYIYMLFALFFSKKMNSALYLFFGLILPWPYLYIYIYTLQKNNIKDWKTRYISSCYPPPLPFPAGGKSAQLPNFGNQTTSCPSEPAGLRGSIAACPEAPRVGIPGLRWTFWTPSWRTSFSIPTLVFFLTC